MIANMTSRRILQEIQEEKKNDLMVQSIQSIKMPESLRQYSNIVEYSNEESSSK